MLPTQKRIACELPTETRNCLSLPTKVGFFEKVPTEERKELGATHLWNQAIKQSNTHTARATGSTGQDETRNGHWHPAEHKTKSKSESRSSRSRSLFNLKFEERARTTLWLGWVFETFGLWFLVCYAATQLATQPKKERKKDPVPNPDLNWFYIPITISNLIFSGTSNRCVVLLSAKPQFAPLIAPVWSALANFTAL